MGTGYEQLTVEQIREALLSAGMDEDTVKSIKGKGNLAFEANKLGISPSQICAVDELAKEGGVAVGELSEAQLDPEDDSFGTGTSERDESEEVNPKAPMKGDPGWHDHVMTMFEKDEIDRGCPTVNGLRRVANRLYGEFSFSGPVDFHITHGQGPDDPGKATCIYEVAIFEGAIKARGMSDSYVGNTDDNFAIYPSAIAETRAEGRALRKLLGLKIHAAEETTNKDGAAIISNYVHANTSTTGEWSPDVKISSAQMLFINSKCRTLGIDVDKFVNLGKSTPTKLEQLSKGEAQGIIEEINRYQSAEAKTIPAEILLAAPSNE